MVTGMGYLAKISFEVLFGGVKENSIGEVRPFTVSGFTKTTASYCSIVAIHKVVEYKTDFNDPQQNTYIEHYNQTLYYDRLAHYLFDSIEEV